MWRDSLLSWTWIYWNSVALLVGAERNAELAKESAKGQLHQKDQAGTEDTFLGPPESTLRDLLRT